MLQIKLKPKAEEDLETIFDYGANSFGFALASEYIHNLDEAFKLLANSPRLGMKQDVIPKDCVPSRSVHTLYSFALTKQN